MACPNLPPGSPGCSPSRVGWVDSPTRGLVALLLDVTAGPVGVVEPALGEGHLGPRRALPAAGRAQLGDGEGLGRVEVVEQGVEAGQGVDQRQRVPQRAPGAEALEVPRDVLAELLA